MECCQKCDTEIFSFFFFNHLNGVKILLEIVFDCAFREIGLSIQKIKNKLIKERKKEKLCKP